ncbi:hypothetical protein OC25_17650 [Pedobacter kyungheensis]|uniref:Uncharacterized protein n=1 Tax=Pedobacter kyungheensis TaxID=1069985 RepID=A0A0C1FWL9_9SPHI|nr:hypothetical protein OC25_17650 [Pedobacter kyungheensis]
MRFSDYPTIKPLVAGKCLIDVMNSYHFNIYPVDTSQAQVCIVHFDRGIYHVYVEGNEVGMMVRDKSEFLGFATMDEPLKPLIEEISGHLNERNLREKFAMDIRSRWNVIIEARFLNEETLMVYISPETDFDEFANCVRDTVYDYVEFDEHLNLILAHMNGEEVVDIQIN